MMRKVILNLDNNNAVYDVEGMFIGTLTGTFTEYKETSSADNTLQLVKQGVTVDEIIKLKNADLI